MQTFLGFLGNAGVVAAVIALVEFLIKRHDEKKGRLASIETKVDSMDKKLGVMEKDEIRTQLLLLLSDYPDNQENIMTLAQYYFATLEGNWYLTSLFNHWLEERDIAKPEWFQQK